MYAGGAGGKGTWGALGSELAEEEVDGAIDANDPNYDEANPDNREFKIKVINVDRSNEELQVRHMRSFCITFQQHNCMSFLEETKLDHGIIITHIIKISEVGKTTSVKQILST